MKYEKANVEVVKFDNSDVITTSACTGHTHTSWGTDCVITNAQWDPGHGGEGPGAGEPFVSPEEFDTF